MHNTPSHILSDRAYERLSGNLEAINEEAFRNRGLRAKLASSYVGVDDCGEQQRAPRSRLSSSVLSDPRINDGFRSASRRSYSAHKARGAVYGSYSGAGIETSSQKNLYSPNLFRLGLLGRNPYYIHTDLLALERKRLKIEVIADNLARNLNNDVDALRASANRVAIDQQIREANPKLNLDHYLGLSVEIKDVKRQLNDFVENLKSKERRITDNLINLTEEELLRNSPRGSVSHRSSSASARYRKDGLNERTTARETMASSILHAPQLSERDYARITSTGTLPAFTPHYRDIGGDPRYYPQADLDISRERFSTEIKNPDPLRVKRDILRDRLASAERKAKDLARIRREQLAVAHEVELSRLEEQRVAGLLEVMEHGQRHVATRSDSRHKQAQLELSSLKSKRAMGNHDMNILRDKILRLRKTQSQLESQLSRTSAATAAGRSTLANYQSLVRENLELKRRAVLAGAVLRNGL